MNRREFLARMFQAGLVVAAPKIIFDMGASSFRRIEIITRDFVTPAYSLKDIQGSPLFLEVFQHITKLSFEQARFFKEFNIGKLAAGLEPATV